MPVEKRRRTWIPDGGIRAVLVGGNTVGAAVRETGPRADGYRHVDTPALVAKLKDLGVNTYLYGIWDSATDWDDLRLEFLPAAAAAGIDVWPYLVPPSETDENGRASRPFMTDYVAWAGAMADLSARYPNLRAWAIDDFEFEVNARLFTPEYMRAMREAQDAVKPDLGFYTCVYHRVALDDAFLDKYAPFIDGVIYPFLDGPNKNTHVASSVDEDIAAIREHTAPRDLGLVLLVYAGRFLDSVIGPTEDYVDQALERGLRLAAAGDIEGVIAYGTQLDDAPTIASDNKAMYGNGRLAFTIPSGVEVPAGTTAEASQVIRPRPGAARYELSFWHFDGLAGMTGPAGDLVKQLAVDGEVVWECDVHHEPWPLWIQGHSLVGPVDLTAALSGKREATLALRLRAARDIRITRADIGFDHLEPVNFTLSDPGFETGAGWTLSTSDGRISPLVDIFAPDRPRRIRETVTRRFRAIASPAG